MTSLHAHALTILITDIGDTASLIGITAAGAIYLISRGARRAAMFLVTAFCLSALFIGLLKLAFSGCHHYVHFSGVESPSGHAADSASVFWAYAILMRTQLEDRRRLLPMLLLTLLIIAIAVSRVMLEAHTTPEVIIGLLAGWSALSLARFFVLRGADPGVFDAYVLAIWGVAAAFITHGMHLPAEDWLRSLAKHLKGHVPFCG